MKKILVLIIVLQFFYGCGSSSTSIEATTAWLNKTSEDVIKAWGKDTIRSIPHDLNAVLIYKQIRTIDSKPNQPITESGTNRKIPVPPSPKICYTVYTYFYIKDDYVINWKIEYEYDSMKSKK